MDKVSALTSPFGRRGGRAGLFIGSHPYCSHALTRSYEASGGAVQFANAVCCTMPSQKKSFDEEMRADLHDGMRREVEACSDTSHICGSDQTTGTGICDAPMAE